MNPRRNPLHNYGPLFDNQAHYRFTRDQRAELEPLWATRNSEGYESEWIGLDPSGVTANNLTQQLIDFGSRNADGTDRTYLPGSQRVLAPSRETAAPVVEFGVEPFDLADAEAVHEEMRHSAFRFARRHGMHLLFHSLPLTTPPEGILTTPYERAQRFDAEYRQRGRQIVSAGEQAQVGTFEDPDEIVKVMNFVAPWLHVLMAMSACSPFHRGTYTGYQSFRPTVFSNAPTVGLRNNFVDWDDYEVDTRRILDIYGYPNSGDTAELTTVDHDWMRPTRFNTVELRVFDVSPSLAEPALWSYLARGLVHTARAELRDYEVRLALWDATLKQHALFQAARDGCSGALVDPYTGRLSSAETVVGELFELVEPWLKDFGVWERASDVADYVLRNGNGGTRILRMFQELQRGNDRLKSISWDSATGETMSAGESIALTAQITAHALYDDLTVECRPRVVAAAKELAESFSSHDREHPGQAALDLL